MHKAGRFRFQHELRTFERRTMKQSKAILVTGASGLVGRQLLEDFKEEYRIFAIARRSQQECGATVHPNIAWLRADIADTYAIDQAFREVATAGGVEVVFHLAAYYDFTNIRHPEYYRSNVQGTRNVLTLARELAPKRFVFTSSVAACSFPAPGEVIDEDSPPDGEHVYSWSKRLGEEMLLEDKNTLPTSVVRLGAVFTDWCEYAPLYVFLKTWLEKSWRSRMLAGKGEAAIPYIHIRDVVSCFRRIIECAETLPSKNVLHACTEGATSHKRLFELATRYYHGKERKPLFLPATLCRMGLIATNLFARLTRQAPPFEQPWMLRYADRSLNVSIDRTREQLGWAPKPRHLIDRRIPYMLERMKSEPVSWHVRNTLAMMRDPRRPGFRLHSTLSNLEYTICEQLVRIVRTPSEESSFPLMAAAALEETQWYGRLLYRLLLSSIHNGNKMLLQNYFEMTVDTKYRNPDYAKEIIALLEAMNERIHAAVDSNAALAELADELQHFVALPLEFAIDEVLAWQEVQAKPAVEDHGGDRAAQDGERLRVRAQLEETIWKCLVMRNPNESEESR
jgi:nucleoside-diphosphate-sugar epimerase